MYVLYSETGSFVKMSRPLDHDLPKIGFPVPEYSQETTKAEKSVSSQEPVPCLGSIGNLALAERCQEI